MTTMAPQRVAFMATVLVAAATFWVVPRLPMADLPQHAGQVALWRDLLLGQSKWQSLVETNYFTPYLAGYGLALLLSFVMSVSAALKLVLTIAYLGFVFACVALRRRLGGDPRLDWLFIPSFFGYAYALGFYTFLLAAPLGILFILLAHHYASRPTATLGVAVLAADLGLFFCHGLIFLFANVIGGLFLLIKCERWTRLPILVLPYIAAGLLCLAYARAALPAGEALTGAQAGIYWGWDLYRINLLLFAAGWSVGGPGLMPLLVALMLAAPLVLGARPRRHDLAAYVPLLVTLAIWAAVPHRAGGADCLYLRFSMFLLPAYAFIFPAPEPARRPSVAARAWLPRAFMPVVCWAFLAVHAERLLNFARESAGFEAVLAATEPNARALAVVFDPGSTASGNMVAYLNFPTWYQAEKQGFVDFNFATYLPQVVRYRRERAPGTFSRAVWAEHPDMGFDWERDRASVYRYFFVRSRGPLPPTYFPTGQCRPILLKSDGEWSLFENVDCHDAG